MAETEVEHIKESCSQAEPELQKEPTLQPEQKSSSERSTQKSIKKLAATRVESGTRHLYDETLSVEEPLEIRIASGAAQHIDQLAITMRTPGADEDLAIGFLLTEGVIQSAEDVTSIEHDRCNTVLARLSPDVEIDRASLERHTFVASSCGVCGKKSIAAVSVKCLHSSIPDYPTVASEVLCSLPEILRSAQNDFDATGGLHASALFDAYGDMLALREDVGRHNALDKLLGWALRSDLLPLSRHILLVSGRASFELVQKASHAGIPIICAVGAPSSLAVDLAMERDITLVGFLRHDRLNVYCGGERIS